jgi:dTDP-4-amino-4,6-dideoxygalactose transaminase
LLAAIGRGQLRALPDRVAARRRNFDAYRAGLGGLPGWSFMPEAPTGTCTRWLTCVTIDPSVCAVDREVVRQALERADIEARPLWKPMHMQPVFSECPVYGGAVGRHLFETGLCLPSGSALGATDRARVVDVIRGVVATNQAVAAS